MVICFCCFLLGLTEIFLFLHLQTFFCGTFIDTHARTHNSNMACCSFIVNHDFLMCLINKWIECNLLLLSIMTYSTLSFTAKIRHRHRRRHHIIITKARRHTIMFYLPTICELILSILFYFFLPKKKATKNKPTTIVQMDRLYT